MRRGLTAAIGALLLLGVGGPATASAAGGSTAALRDLVIAAGGAPSQVHSAQFAYLEELDPNLQALAAGDPLPAGAGLSVPGPPVTIAGATPVDIYVSGEIGSAVARLEGLGMKIEAVSRQLPERMVEGYLPLAAAADAAALADTTAIVSTPTVETDTGSVLSQGDAVQHGPQARALGASGAGVKVGVMSDSIDKIGGGIAESQASGNLPASVTDLGDSATGKDEGRAMSEIIYDVAPGITEMVFDTSSGGPATKAKHIQAMIEDGARVIADDTVYLGEPFFQDGVVAQEVDAAKAQGVAYLASAGNRARQSWEGVYSPSGGKNNFGGGDTRQSVIELEEESTMVINLQWNEPWNAATDKFAINVYKEGTFAFTCAATNPVPYNRCEIENAEPFPVEIEIEIERTAGAGAPLLKYIVSGTRPFTILEHDTSSPAINPDGASARGSLAIAAICWSTSASKCTTPGLTTPEAYSSRGPVTRTRDALGNALATPEVRAKPNVAGADAVSTSVPGFGVFGGTSAATPDVAGVAALALSVNPALSVDQLYALLTNPANAIDCTSAAGVPDTDCGAGLIQADRVVAAQLPPAPPAPTPPSPAPPVTPPVIRVVPAPHCKVPKLRGKGLGAARTALRRANCKLGKVHPKKNRPPHAVVKASQPKQGAERPAGAKVSVTLGEDEGR